MFTHRQKIFHFNRFGYSIRVKIHYLRSNLNGVQRIFVILAKIEGKKVAPGHKSNESKAPKTIRCAHDGELLFESYVGFPLADPAFKIHTKEGFYVYITVCIYTYFFEK